MEDSPNHPNDSWQFVGSAVIAGAFYGPRTTTLQLQTFAGQYIEYTMDDIPDPAGEAEFRGSNLRPISVKIQAGGEQCTAIVLASDGPRRSNVTLGTALALYRSGVQAVVDGGLQLGVSCSTYKRPRKRPSCNESFT
jgi:hypothetical protein